MRHRANPPCFGHFGERTRLLLGAIPGLQCQVRRGSMALISGPCVSWDRFRRALCWPFSGAAVNFVQNQTYDASLQARFAAAARHSRMVRILRVAVPAAVLL